MEGWYRPPDPRGVGEEGGPSDESDAPEEIDLDAAAHVACPYCGETVEIVLDPGGGAVQQYVEDCEVCCRPWQVEVRYDAVGQARVSLEPAD